MNTALRPRPSPYIAHNAEQQCLLISLYGGCITDSVGNMATTTGVTYVRREGVAVPLIIHVENVESRTSFVFVLDEVSGFYRSGTKQLWPLSGSPSVFSSSEASRHLPSTLADIVDNFLSDELVHKPPLHAESCYLRCQIRLYSFEPTKWEAYWERGRRAELLAGNRRIHKNIWPSRKRVCMNKIDVL